MIHRKPYGFTLIELVLTIIIIAILFTVSARLMGNSVDTKKYQASIAEMTQIRNAVIGDGSYIGGGRLIDFGYFGTHDSFPATGGGNINFLANYFSSTTPYNVDAWNNAYAYARAASTATVTCDAKPGATGVAYESDITLTFQRALYEDNLVYVNVFDMKGTILRGDDRTVSGDGEHQIATVRLTKNGGAYNTVVTVPDIANNNNTSFRFTGVPIGNYTVTVTLGTGTGGAQGTKDWRPYLNFNNTTFTKTTFVIAKGPNRMQVIYVRLPGAVNGVFLQA